MHLPLNILANDLDKIESIEKAALRLLTQAIFDYREQAVEIFRNETDNVSDIGEDVTQEAIANLGLSKIHRRLYGKVDFKRACYLFLPEFSVRLALFIDSKAEKQATVARLQMSQLSMEVRQVRNRMQVTVPGLLPKILSLDGEDFLTITMFVKYVYRESASGNVLDKILITSLPNGMLQVRYNPTHDETIFVAGPNAPTLGEEFRTRLSFSRLRAKQLWRVQEIQPGVDFSWVE